MLRCSKYIKVLSTIIVVFDDTREFPDISYHDSEAC